MTLVQVAFKKGGKPYTFEASMPVKIGDTVGVFTDVMGYTTGEVVSLESDYDGPVRRIERVIEESVPLKTNTAPKDWRPDKGMTAPGVQVRKVVDLSHAQCDALAELAATMKPHHRLWVQQTKTQSGGTHLYVRKGLHGSEYHIGRDGNVIKMGVVEPGAH